MQNVVDLQRVGRRQSLVKPDRPTSYWCDGWQNSLYPAIPSPFLSKCF